MLLPWCMLVFACLLFFQHLLQLLHLHGGLVLIAALLVLLPHPALPSTRTHSLNARGQLRAEQPKTRPTRDQQVHSVDGSRGHERSGI